MNKRSNPFYPQHNTAYQRPPPPPPPPTAPSQAYDYNYWTSAPQSGQPPPLPPPLQPGAPIPQWNPSAQQHPGMIATHVPPGQTALYANYGYGGARQSYSWQQRPPIPPQQPRQSFPVPQPYFVPPSHPQQQPQHQPQPQPPSHPSRGFSAPFPQNQPNYRSHQPVFQPLPPQQSPPHLPPAKRARFEGPSNTASGSQSQNASSQSFGRGGSAPSGPFIGSSRVPTGPSRNASGRGRGGIGGGPSIGMMRVGAGNAQSSRGGGGGGGGRGGSHSSRGGQIGGHRGGRGNWHTQGHGRRGGGGGSGGGGNSAARGRGGSFSHSGIVRQNGSMNTSEKERSSGKKEDSKQTLTDFKIIGLEIENMLWKWGVCSLEGSSDGVSADQTESESKPISTSKPDVAIDELKLELSDRVEEIEFGAALKEQEENVVSSSSAATNHVTRAEKPAKPFSSSSQSPPRIRIYFNTPVVTEDMQKSNVSNGVVSTRSKRRMPADGKGDDEDEGRRIRAKLNPTSEESTAQDVPLLDVTKEADSAPPSIDPSVASIRTEDEGDWLMEAIAKDGDGDGNGNLDRDETHVPPEDDQKQSNSGDAEGEVDEVADPPSIHAEGDDINIVDHVDATLVEENDVDEEEIPFDNELGEETDPVLVFQIEPPPSSVPSAADPAEDAIRLQPEDTITVVDNEFITGPDVELALSHISEDTSQQSSLSQTLHSSSSSSTVVSTTSVLIPPASSSSINTEKKRPVPSANRISILYASGARRLAINSEVVEGMKIWRGRGRIEISLRLEREGEKELRGLFPEVYCTETQSFTPSSLTASDDLFPPWSRLIIPSKVTLTIHLDKEKPLTEPRWVKTGDLEEWLRNTFGIFWVSGEDGWEKRIEVVDPDPPPTIHTVLENWSNGSLVGLETERQRFIKTHMSESDNLLEILLRLVRGERATPLSSSNNAASSNLHLSGPLLTALSPSSSHAGQQTHLTLAIVAMVRMAESFAVRSLPTEEAKREVDDQVGEIIRCLPQHLLYKSLDGIFREWKDTRKRGGR